MSIASQATSTTTRIVEVRRTGTGVVSSEQFLGQQTFEWDGQSHSGAQGDLKYKLSGKVVRKVIPGDNTVVHQNMSSSWDPFEIQGEWIDRWIGQGKAWETFLQFAKFVSRLPLVRLTLDKMSWVGVLTDLEIAYRTVDQIGWTCTISPEVNESVDDVRGDFGPVIFQKSIPQWLTEAGDQAQALNDLEDSVVDLSLSTQDLLDHSAALAEMDDAVQRVKDVGQNGITEDAERQLMILATNFRRVRSAGINAAFDVSDKRADISMAFDDIIQTLRYETWVHQTIVEAYRAVGLSYDAEIDMRSRAALRPKAVYHPKKGESLERISMKFYGTPNNAIDIFKANHLASYHLDGTEELIIPQPGV